MDTPRTREFGDEVKNLKDQIADGVEKGRYNLAELQKAVTEKSKAVVESTNRVVQDNPWSAIGVAAAIGFAIGLLIPRD
ncbi:MAG: transrane protein [Verrucomicrobiales bacterium]|jgi:ElaB/YqjD/DUF883 family membrane-anchored ribosome-binding protein|nr:transrane protein [Verrucomicrobiales bacterium]